MLRVRCNPVKASHICAPLQLILDSAWSPRFNAAQLDILPARGTLLAEL